MFCSIMFDSSMLHVSQSSNLWVVSTNLRASMPLCLKVVTFEHRTHNHLHSYKKPCIAQSPCTQQAQVKCDQTGHCFRAVLYNGSLTTQNVNFESATNFADFNQTLYLSDS